jgi:hypothetical protein
MDQFYCLLDTLLEHKIIRSSKKKAQDQTKHWVQLGLLLTDLFSIIGSWAICMEKVLLTSLTYHRGLTFVPHP